MKRHIFAIGCLALGMFPALQDGVADVIVYSISSAFRRNFHEVVPGALYRSGQMPRAELAAIIREHGIRSVIDLRLQDDAADSSGMTESAAVEREGATYIHIPLTSTSADQRKQLEALSAAFRSAPEPVLIHCSDGTHRTGVASAIWLLQAGYGTMTALSQLDLRFGFLGLERWWKARLNGHPTLDAVIARYVSDHRAGDQSGRDIDDWLQTAPKLY